MKKENRIYLIIFCATLLFGALIRLINLDSDSLRLDETQSVWQASHSTEFIREYMLKNVHLPLHNTLLHYWMAYFGTGEGVVRMLAVIPGILALPALYFLAKELIGKRPALLALVFAAISPFWVWYSREIRMYTLLTLVTTLSYLFYIKILKENKTIYYVLYILVNAIGMYTHYFFFLVLAAQGIFYLLTMNKQWEGGVIYNKKRQLVSLILSAVVLALIFLPWFTALTKSYGSGSLAPVLQRPTAFNVILSFFEFTFGFQPELISSSLISFWPLVILFGFIFLTKRRTPFSLGFDLAVLGTVFPVFLVFFVSLVYKPMYLTRYLTTATPLFFVLLAWYLNELVGKTKYLLTGTVISLFMIALFFQFTSHDNPARENYRDAISYIEENTTPRDIVVISPAYTLYPFQYYYSGSTKVSSIPVWNKKKGGIPETTAEKVQEDAQALEKGHQRMFLLITMNLNGSDIVKSYLDTHYTKLEKRQFSKDIWVHVYQAEYF